MTEKKPPSKSKKRLLSPEEKLLFEKMMQDVRQYQVSDDALDDSDEHTIVVSTKQNTDWLGDRFAKGSWLQCASLYKGEAYNTGIDKNTLKKLKAGTYPIDASLDLHGLTVANAHHQFQHFMRSSLQLKRRLVIVITGKGGVPGSGKIKEEFIHWMEERWLKPMVVLYRKAAPHHGGGGAYYILLKRLRTWE